MSKLITVEENCVSDDEHEYLGYLVGELDGISKKLKIHHSESLAFYDEYINCLIAGRNDCNGYWYSWCRNHGDPSKGFVNYLKKYQKRIYPLQYRISMKECLDEIRPLMTQHSSNYGILYNWQVSQTRKAIYQIENYCKGIVPQTPNTYDDKRQILLLKLKCRGENVHTLMYGETENICTIYSIKTGLPKARYPAEFDLNIFYS